MRFVDIVKLSVNIKLNWTIYFIRKSCCTEVDDLEGEQVNRHLEVQQKCPSRYLLFHIQIWNMIYFFLFLFRFKYHQFQLFVYNFWWNFKKNCCKWNMNQKGSNLRTEKKFCPSVTCFFCVFSSKKMKSRVNSSMYLSCDYVLLICKDCHNHNSQKI